MKNFPTIINLKYKNLKNLIKIVEFSGRSVDDIMNKLLESYVEQTEIEELKNVNGKI